MDLSPGETIIYEGHPSWRSILSFYIKGLLIVAIAGGIAAAVSAISEDEVKTGWVALAALVVFAVVLVVGWLKRLATVYRITNRRLHIKRGIIARKTEETRIERVTNANTSQSVLERLLRVGTVDFDVASGEREGLFQFKGVANPPEVVRAVDRALPEAERAPTTTT